MHLSDRPLQADLCHREQGPELHDHAVHGLRARACGSFGTALGRVSKLTDATGNSFGFIRVYVYDVPPHKVHFDSAALRRTYTDAL